jgi:excisionase family DNA binding protein
MPMAYSIRDAVRVSGLSRARIYVLIKAGLLPVAKIGKRALIRHQDLEALIDKHLTRRGGKAA